MQSAADLAKVTPGQVSKIVFSAAGNAATQEDLADYLENELDIFYIAFKKQAGIFKHYCYAVTAAGAFGHNHRHD